MKNDNPQELEDVLQRKREPLIVEADSRFEVSEKSATRVELRSYLDLQRLALVPKGADEARIRGAIKKDDQLIRSKVLDKLSSGDCGCRSPIPERRQDLQTSYVRARNQYHPHLAEALTEAVGPDIQWNGKYAQRVYRAVSLVAVSYIPVNLFLYTSIVIKKNGVLTYTDPCPGGVFVEVTEIKAYAGSQIICTNPSFFIQCNTAEGNIGATS